MKISMIAASSENRVIGRNKDLPWHLPDDFEFFKNTTRGHHVVMGRKNWESLPSRFRPLPDRPNLVVTRKTDLKLVGAQVFNDLDTALAFAETNGEKECFIIGGGEIYRLGMAYASQIYLTEIKEVIEGDTFFPILGPEWQEVNRQHHPRDGRHAFAFDFVTYQKK